VRSSATEPATVFSKRVFGFFGCYGNIKRSKNAELLLLPFFTKFRD